MTRDVLTIDEELDDDTGPESMGSGSEDSDGPQAILPVVDSGATVNFMHDPVRRKREQKVKQRKKRLTKKEESSKRKQAAEKIILAMVKPDASTDRERERYLRRIATKGVVQLFNAVTERQRTMSKALQQKMTAKERKEVKEQFRGSQFNVYQNGGTKAEEDEDDDNFVKKEEEPDEEMDAEISE